MKAGVLYFVINKPGRAVERTIKAHYNLAVRSAKSLKVHMPHLPTTLFTNLDLSDLDSDCFSNVIVTKSPEDMWTYKYECLLSSPYEHTLHMDADTYVCDNFSEVFDLLSNFDLVAPLSPYYRSLKLREVPNCFPELAGGFMLWKKNKKTQDLLTRILELVQNRVRGVADEPYIRKALYESDVRYAVIPWEYNCVCLLAGYLFSKVKVIHGRSDDIVRDAKVLNMSKSPRIYTGETLFLLRRCRKRRKFVEVDKAIHYGHYRGEE